jgi:hypothetical protein
MQFLRVLLLRRLQSWGDVIAQPVGFCGGAAESSNRFATTFDFKIEGPKLPV